MKTKMIGQQFLTYYSKIFLFLILYWPSQSILLAEVNPSIRFEIPRVNGEAFEQEVHALMADSKGFLWFATSIGLARYDGYTLKWYKHDPQNPQSISGNRTRELWEDKDGFIWIGTEKTGINRFDPRTELFEHYWPADSEPPFIEHLYQDSLGTFWISTWEHGLFRFEADSGQFTHYLTKENDPSSLGHIVTYKVLEDVNKKGNLWIATAGGLDYFDREKQTFIHYRPDVNKPNSLSNQVVWEIYYDSNENLWVGTDNGLNQFIPSSGKFLSYYPNIENINTADKGNHISAIFESNNDELLIGTEDGFNVFNRNTKKFSKYKYDPSNRYSISGNMIIAKGIVKDESGLVWILTDFSLNQLNLAGTSFKNYQHHAHDANSSNANIVWATYQDRQQRLWLGTDERGLSLLDKQKQTLVNYRHDPNNENSLRSDQVYSVLVDRDETLWVGTGKGLSRKDKSQKGFHHYDFDSENFVAYTSNRIFALAEDHQGLIWIATTRGLKKYNKANDSFTHYFHDAKDPSSLVSNWIRALFVDQSGRVWVGTSAGLELYNPKTDGFIHFIHDPDSSNSLSNNNIYSITQSQNGYLWIGTFSGGVNRLDIKNNYITRYTKKDGLLDDTVFGVIEDDNEDIWIANPRGLSSLNQQTEELRHFFPKDGAQPRGYTNLLSQIKLDNGEIVLGGADGITSFFPDDIADVASAPKVVLTNFSVLNKTVPLKSELSSYNQNLRDSNSKTKDGFYLEQSIEYMNHLVLTHKESIFSFEFAALNYLSPNENQYAYKMEGINEDWVHTPATKRFATYMNIPAGEYTFTVKASNKDGVWNEQGRSIRVTILPPPWLTWWAKTIYVLLTLVLLLSAYFIRTASLRRRAENLQKSVEERTQELATEKEKVEQLLQRKNEEFANVSHEFRTPLTLILGPLAQVLKTNKDPAEISQLNIVKRNSYRLLRMVDQLLNLETFRVRSITQQSPQAIGNTIRQLAGAFVDFAKEKNIALEIGHIENINFKFTNDALEKIVANLLSNAIKYTPSNGKIHIHSERTETNQLLIEINDTGIGIAEDKIEFIFERYSRVLNENSEQVTGAGIGLALVKELVESHGGEIAIESKQGIGTTVKVLLPIIDEVDSDQVKTPPSQETITMELMGITNQISGSSEKTEEHRLELVSDKPCVLVVEDNQDMRSYITERIKKDYNVITAKDGTEGVDKALSEIPDLIISDIMMPNKDGYELTNELRRNPITSHIPVILLTARDDKESRLKGWYEKADEYLTKPFDIEELITRMSNLLGIRNILKKRYSELAFQAKSPDLQEKEISPLPALSEENSIDKLQEKFISQLNSVLEKHYTESSTSINVIAADLAMSERQFFRKIKSIVDMTPTDYLRRYRLEKSRELLEEGMSIKHITFEVGFNSQSYYARCFKAQYDVSPTEYTKTHAKTRD